MTIPPHRRQQPGAHHAERSPLPGANRASSRDLRVRLDRYQLELLELYSQTHLLLSCRDFDGAKRRLGAFLIRLRDYAQLKSAHLYEPLARERAGDSRVQVLVCDCQERLAELEHDTRALFNGHAFVEFDEPQAEEFKVALNRLGAAFTHCIEREETLLYPLYKNRG